MKILTILLLAMSMLAIYSCSLNDDESSIDQKAEYKEDLSLLFKNYELIKVDLETMLDRALNYDAAGDVIFSLELEAYPDWTFRLSDMDYKSDEYVDYITDESGNMIPYEDNSRFQVLEGGSIRDDLTGMFIFTDYDFSANIYDNGQLYILEPLAQYTEDANSDLYILYKDSEVVPTQGLECGVTDQQTILNAIEDKVEENVSQRSQAICDELDVSFVGDYKLYQKFNNKHNNTKNYCKSRLMYASYRYWKYNDYNLYFRLRSSNVLTSSSNNPISSNSASTALNQWKNWGNNSSNHNRWDSNILFTGRTSLSARGIAYGGNVCKNESKSYCIVRYNSSTSQADKTTAHEVGHNLGALHTSSGFMKSGGGSTTHMANATKNQIDDHRDDYSGCMANRTCRNSRGF